MDEFNPRIHTCIIISLNITYIYRMQTQKTSPDYSSEDRCRAEGYVVVCGVDEAGRGPLCGPVCAAAVILPSGLAIPGLNDSKKLSEPKRESLYGEILASCVSFGVAYATPAEIDAYNILNATMLAMNRAIAQLSPAPDLALIDGNCKRGSTATPSASSRATAGA